jgi:hypothetical protein
MSLLDDASLLVTPNARKEGKLYSIIPTNGNGDFSVTRATTATRVNAAGLVELVPYNLLQYSEQFDNAYWVKDSGVSVNANVANAPNGMATADRLNLSTGGALYRSALALGTGSFTLSVWLKGEGANIGKQVLLEFTNGDATVTLTGDWQRFTTVGSNVINVAIKRNTAGQADSLLIWGAQINQGTSALDYQATETRLNIPRLDYSLGSCPNILLEPQRTNLGLQSEDLSSASWFKGAGVTITADNTISPSGVQNADRVVGATGTGTWGSANTLGSATSSLLSNTLYTATIYLRSSTTSSQVTLRFRDQTTGLENQIVCNLTSSWKRFEISRTTGASTTALAVVLTNSTADFFAWGRQLEAGAYATSYIPTTSASVTRNADVISRGNIYTNGLITASGGTWFLDIRSNLSILADGGGDALFLGVTTSVNDNCLRISGSTGVANRLSLVKRIGGATSIIFTTTSDTAKIAIKWNGSTADVFVNGVKVVAATAFSETAMQNIATNTLTRKYINSMALFPTPLTDTQCIALTT